jgi:NAD-dependent SIR2 family protein deacetylase
LVISINYVNKAIPHQGHRMLLEIAEGLKQDAYSVFTTNYDEHLLREGFPRDKVFEGHGNINKVQWYNWDTVTKLPYFYDFTLDHDNCHCLDYPRCPECDEEMRPNILLLKDINFVPHDFNDQKAKFDKFLLDMYGRSMTVLEIGSGVMASTGREIGESLLLNSKENRVSYIRINPVKEYKTIRFHVEDGLMRHEDIDPENPDLPDMVKKEIEFFESNISNELIEFKVSALEGIQMIYEEIKQLLKSSV